MVTVRPSRIQSESTLFPATGQAIRYINNFSTIITAEEFETKIGFFVESVIARLVDLGINAPELVGLWKEVCAERQDLALSKWRKLEAIMGFDPDEVPDHIVVGLKDASDNYGAGAVEEVAAASQGKVLDILKELSGAPFAESTGLCMPQFDVLQQEISCLGPTLFPWQKVRKPLVLLEGHGIWLKAQCRLNIFQRFLDFVRSL